MGSLARQIAKELIASLKKAGKLDLLPEVVTTLQAEVKGKRSGVIVTSAYQLDATELAAIASYAKELTGQTLPIENRVDPDLVAGFTLQIGDRFVDTSYAARLAAIKNQFANK